MGELIFGIGGAIAPPSSLLEPPKGPGLCVPTVGRSCQRFSPVVRATSARRPVAATHAERNSVCVKCGRKNAARCDWI